MSMMSATPKKNLMLFSGRAHPELAEQVAKHLDVTITPQSAYNFANGEIFVRFQRVGPRVATPSCCSRTRPRSTTRSWNT